MVLLTMTPAIVAAIEKCRNVAATKLEELQLPLEPSLTEPETGKPISHGQLVDLSKLLKEHEEDITRSEDTSHRTAYSLNELLKGSKVYVPPPPPKKEPAPEYKALMARLRKEEEARAYERMINPSPPAETFSQRFPASANSSLFPATGFSNEDEITYSDVNRQLTLIINILVSIVACSVAIWLWARRWSTPQRLGLSMSGSCLVALAEVAIYLGYLSRIKEAKQSEKKRPEVKEVFETWVIDGSSAPQKEKTISATASSTDQSGDSVRFRKGKHR